MIWKGAQLLDNSTIIKVLGTAQDAGHPQLSCGCSHCQAARKDSSLSRLQSSIAVLDKSKKNTFILDATPAFSRQLDILNELAAAENFDSKHLAGILLTHAHIGHYTGLMYLGKEALAISDLPLYLSRKMLDFLQSNAPWSDLFKNDNLKPVVFEFGKKYKLTENIYFKALEMEHRNEHADTAAFLVNAGKKDFLYLPDFDSWSNFEKSFRKIIRKIDYAFIDGSFFDKKELGELRGRDLNQVPHPPIIETMELLSDIETAAKKKIYFTHFNHTNRILDQDGEKKKVVQEKGFNILEDGDTF